MRKIGERLRWEERIFSKDCSIFVSSPAHAAYILNRSRVLFTFHAMRNLENLPITFPSTEEILSDSELSGAGAASVENALKTRAFASGVDLVADAVMDGSFETSLVNAALIHRTIARHDRNIRPYELGRLRAKPVGLNNVGYLPPSYVELEKIWNSELPELEAIENPLERGLGIFLWMARAQFFSDCNKRTATLVLNGELAANSCHPAIFPANDQIRFMSSLRGFYDSGDATAIIGLLLDYARQSREILDGNARNSKKRSTARLK